MGQNDVIAEEYEFVRMIMALSILQNGPVPQLVPEEILRQVFSDALPGPCIAELRKGFMKLGLYEIGDKRLVNLTEKYSGTLKLTCQ